MIPDSPRFAMVAGEASGDMLAGLLLEGMRARWPALVAEGIGGPKMAEQGFHAWWPHDKLSLFGYVEVLGHFRELVGIRNQLTERLMRDRPDCFIGGRRARLQSRSRGPAACGRHEDRAFHQPVDLGLARPSAIEKIRKAVDLVLCIFPFEPEVYAKRNIRAAYVGHPLASVIPLEPDKPAARRALGLADTDTVVALLPGSRRSEIQYIAPRIFAAATEMHRQRPGLRFVVPVVTGLRHVIEPIRKRYAADVPIELLDGNSHDALAACDVAIVASGTATLETALFKRPMVVVYAMHALTWQMGKRMAYLPLGGAAQHPAARFRGARAAAGQRHRGEDRLGRLRLARRPGRLRGARRGASPASTTRCVATPPPWPDGGDRRRARRLIPPSIPDPDP